MSEQRLMIYVDDVLLIDSVPSGRTISLSTIADYALLAFARWLAVARISWVIREDGEVVSRGEVNRK